MAFRQGNRYQVSMFPPTIEEYIAEDDPVRVYDAFVEALDMEELGIKIEEDKVGNPSYEPRAMLKLLVYGYSYGWRSSRKIERALYHNLSFIWLTGGLRPDHKTIANYRRNNKGAIKKVLKQCVRLCIDLDLIEGNTLFIDGSKMRANASINQTWTHERCEKELKKIDDRIEEIMNECEQADEEEKGNGTLIKLAEELKDKDVLQKRIKAILGKIKEQDKSHINSTDVDCIKVKGRQGTHAGYNAQIAADEKNGLIVNSEVVNKSNDMNQFTRQVEQANEVIGNRCEVACADAGYSDINDLKETIEQGIQVIVPSQRQALHQPLEGELFGKDKFRYDDQSNQYICPEGKALRYSHYSKVKGHYLYRIKELSNCIDCKHFGRCTSNKRGRAIIRLRNEETKEQLETLYASQKGQAVYKKRKEKVELPFGHIKRNLGAGAFLLRGIEGVNAEMALLSTCFNISRMITIVGISRLMAKLYEHSIKVKIKL